MAAAPVSILFPQHLVPEELRGKVKIGLTIGGFLFEKPQTEVVPPPPDAEISDAVKPAKWGRPKKSDVRPTKEPKGKFGSRECRSAEAEIRVLESEANMLCIHKKPFQRLVQQTLQKVVKEHNRYYLPGPFPNPPGLAEDLKLSRGALSILQDAVEAG